MDTSQYAAFSLWFGPPEFENLPCLGPVQKAGDSGFLEVYLE